MNGAQLHTRIEEVVAKAQKLCWSKILSQDKSAQQSLFTIIAQTQGNLIKQIYPQML